MRQLLMTTALVAATPVGAMAQTGQAASPGVPHSAAQDMAPAFLASQFTDMTLYALDSEATRNLRPAGRMDTETRNRPAHDGGTVGIDTRMERWASSDSFLAERDRWESVGTITDIVLTQDGNIRGVLSDVGGFLGLFSRTVMIDIDDIYFVTDEAAPEDVADFFVVAAVSRAQLEALPEWNDEALSAGFARSP